MLFTISSSSQLTSLEIPTRPALLLLLNPQPPPRTLAPLTSPSTPPPRKPSPPSQAAEILLNEIVEVIINNRPAGEGDPNSNATGMVSHPMHMHGHKFWLMGMGMGVFDRTRDGP